jgi:hypothetical protein
MATMSVFALLILLLIWASISQVMDAGATMMATTVSQDGWMM